MNVILIVVAILSTGELQVQTEQYDNMRDCKLSELILKRMLTEVDNTSNYLIFNTSCGSAHSI